MLRARHWDWETELPNGLAVLISATITGHDTPWSASAIDPPEYREVEIIVSQAFDHGLTDVTDGVDRLYKDFIEEMRVLAIQMEDDKIAAMYEDFDPEDDHADRNE